MQIILIIAAFLVSAFLTGLIRSVLIKRRQLDIPNERSSHTQPTPRGGGMAFIVTFFAGLTALYALGDVSVNLFAALVLGGIIVGIVGYIDDIQHLRPYVRLIFQFIAALIGTALIGGVPRLDLGFTMLELGWLGYALVIVGTIWLINLYNFMDGIDGIAASEAMSVCLTTGVLLLSAASGFAGICLLLAASCFGFLLWNWSPARIFMGDVGSGFLGYTLAILAIATGEVVSPLPWIWLILLGVFVVDTLVTLVNRVRRGEKWHEAHRSHAYQHAVTQLNSHSHVTTAVILINLLWLTPCAVLVWVQPHIALLVTLVAFAPLVGLAIYYRAGIDLNGSKQADKITIGG